MSDDAGVSLFGLNLNWIGVIGVVVIALGCGLLLFFLGELRTAQYHGPPLNNAFLAIVLLVIGFGMLMFGKVKPATS